MVKDTRKIKKTKYVNEDLEQVKKLIILLLIVSLLCVGLYFLAETLISNKAKNKTETKTEIKFNYDIATIGTMFNRPEKEYYVLIYSNKDEGTTYNSLLNTYRSSDDYVKTYYIDLDLKMNNSAIKEELNKKPKTSNEVSVKGATLYKIKDGKVTNCYDTLETIKEIIG